MKKQEKKVTKKASPKAKKASKKEKPESIHEETQESEQPKESQPESQPQNIEQEPPQPEQPIIEEWQKLTSEQRERLLFKYGARIADADLEGTKDDVAQKIAEKTGDVVGEVRKFID